MGAFRSIRGGHYRGETPRSLTQPAVNSSGVVKFRKGGRRGQFPPPLTIRTRANGLIAIEALNNF